MPKNLSAVPAKQKSLFSYFGKGKVKAEPTDDDEVLDEDVVMDADVDADAEEEDADADASTGKEKLAPEESPLPPISHIPAIFSDIVSRVPEIAQVAERIKGRKLRVATMCSGTESPLLALGLITRSIQEQFGVGLEVEHVFSCEIVPFKQAYIERNFQPPLLFRDVCELGDHYA